MKKLHKELLAIHEDGEHPVYHILSLINEVHSIGKFARSAMRDLGYNVKNHPDGKKDDPFGLHRSIRYFECFVSIYMGICKDEDYDEKVANAIDRSFMTLREATLVETISYFGTWCQPGKDGVEAYLTLIAYLNDPRLTYLAIFLLVRYSYFSQAKDSIEFNLFDAQKERRIDNKVIEHVVDYLNDQSPFFAAASYVLYNLEDRRALRPLRCILKNIDDVTIYEEIFNLMQHIRKVTS